MNIATSRNLRQFLLLWISLRTLTTIAAAAPATPPGERVPPALLSGLESRDSQSIWQLRSNIFERACSPDVATSLGILATNKALSYEEVDLIVHAAVFCPEHGTQLISALVTHLDLASIKRVDVQHLIVRGAHYLKKETNELQRLSTFWDSLNSRLIADTRELSDGEIYLMVNDFRKSKTASERDKIREVLRPLGALGRTNLLSRIVKDLAELDPEDPYAATDLAKFLYAFDGEYVKALSLLRDTWTKKRHLPALAIYAGAVMQFAASGKSGVSPPEVRNLAYDLLQFQEFSEDNTALLVSAGYLLKAEDPENLKLIKRILAEANMERINSRSDLKQTFDAVRSSVKPE